MSKTSKNLGIAGSLILIITTAIVSIIVILAAIGLMATGKTENIAAGTIALIISVIALSITLVFPIIILVLLNSKNKSNKKILTAGIISIVIAGLSILGSLTNPIYLINLIAAGLLLASGIMICIEYNKAK